MSPFPEIEFNAGDEKIVDVLYYSNIQSESGDIYWEATFTDDYTAEGENVGNIVLDPTTVVLDYASDDKPVTVTIGSDGKIYDGKVSGYVIGITLDWSGYYHSSIGYMKALGSSPCRPPLEFINHILMGKAIEYSVLCGDYSEAIELWNTLFINGVQPNTGGCGCRT